MYFIHVTKADGTTASHTYNHDIQAIKRAEGYVKKGAIYARVSAAYSGATLFKHDNRPSVPVGWEVAETSVEEPDTPNQKAELGTPEPQLVTIRVADKTDQNLTTTPAYSQATANILDVTPVRDLMCAIADDFRNDYLTVNHYAGRNGLTIPQAHLLLDLAKAVRDGTEQSTADSAPELAERYAR